MSMILTHYSNTPTLQLPMSFGMWQNIKEDIQVIFQRDPAVAVGVGGRACLSWFSRDADAPAGALALAAEFHHAGARS